MLRLARCSQYPSFHIGIVLLHYIQPDRSFTIDCPSTTHLCPLAQDAHHHQSSDQPKAGDADRQCIRVGQLGLCTVRAHHPVTRPHLDNADPDEDAGGEGVERANGDDGRGIVAVERLEDADANGHAERRDKRKERGEPHLLTHGKAGRLVREEGRVRRRGRIAGAVGLAVVRGASVVRLRGAVAVRIAVGANRGNSGTERETLKDLMKQNDDEERDKVLVRRNDKGKPNDCDVLVTRCQVLLQGAGSYVESGRECQLPRREW